MASPAVPIPSLTAVRGLFAVWVVLFHFKREFGSISDNQILSQGFLAVDMFFVLSGFILSHVYADALIERRITFGNFFSRRIARIYPLHLVTLLTVTLLYLFGHFYGLVDYAFRDLNEFWSHLFLVHAWGVSDYVALNIPSWSISAEFIAYTLFIVPLWLIYKSGARNALLGAIVFFLATWLFVKVYGEDFFGSPRLFGMPVQYSFLRILPEFFLGMCSYRYAAEKLSVMHPLYLLLCVATMTITLILKIHVLFVLMSGALYALMFLNNPKVPRWFYFLGLISFSLYMVHMPFQIVAFKIGGLLLDWPYHETPLLWLPIFMVMVVGLAIATFFFVEQPSNRLCLRLFRSVQQMKHRSFWKHLK